jgi:hypothetical protein
MHKPKNVMKCYTQDSVTRTEERERAVIVGENCRIFALHKILSKLSYQGRGE